MAYLDDLPDKMPPVAIAAIPRPRRCLARWRTWKPSCSLVHEIDEPKKSWGLEKPGIIFILYSIYIYGGFHSHGGTPSALDFVDISWKIPKKNE